MSRRLLTPLLLLFVLLPVPVLFLLGEQGIRSVEEADRRLLLEQARADLLRDLRRHLLARRSSSWFALDDPALIAVADQPDGSFLAQPALHRARVCAGAGEPVEALEALDPLLLGAAIDGRLAGLLFASDLLADLGHSNKAARFRSDARSAAEKDPVNPAVARWAGLRSSDEGVDQAALVAWCEEVQTRGSDVQELVLLRDLVRSASAADRLGELLGSRQLWPGWAEVVRQRVQAVGVEGAALLWTRVGWFGVAADRSSARHLLGLSEWLADWQSEEGVGAALARVGIATDATPPILAGVVRGEDLTLDLGGFAIVATLPASKLFGPLDPRLVLVAGLALYLLLALLLTGALIRHQRRAEELVEARGDLIAQVTHELRTPLTVLRLYGESLLERRVPEEQRGHYLSTIVDESERLGALVDRVAAAARGTADGSGRAGPLDPLPILEQVTEKFGVVARSRSGALTTSLALPPELRLAISADDLHRILETLLDNALRYAGDPPRVHVTAERLAGSLRIVVEDEGPGIPEEEREQVFERWVRGQVGQASGTRGAGMGLHLARQTARDRGGDVTIDARPGGGLRVVVRLPLRDGAIRNGGEPT